MASSRLTEEQQAAWRGLLDMHDHLVLLLNRDLQARMGLSLADYDVLVGLVDAPEGRLRMFELCDLLAWDRSRLSKQVTRLLDRGLVVRVPCEEDRRGAYVALTASGRHAIDQSAPAYASLVKRLVFDALSDDQVRTLAQVSAAVLERARSSDLDPARADSSSSD